MAKKKGRRSVKVARKREKRNRNRKSRQKQLAIEKQRRLPYGKSEEQYLHACISQSRKLLDEPELEGVLFDFELMYRHVTEVLDDYQTEQVNVEEFEEDLIYLTPLMDEVSVKEEELNLLQEAERACEHFRLRVLPYLVTPAFMQQLVQALIACETRLKRAGNSDLAEVAFVTRSLLEAAPPEILAFHPMIQTIGIETLRILVEEPDMIADRHEEVTEILSNVLEYEDAETYESQPIPIFSDTTPEHSQQENFEPVLREPPPPQCDTANLKIPDPEQEVPAPEQPSTLLTESVYLPEPTTAEIETPVVSPDELPARALYKNFNGLAIKENFEYQTDNADLQAELTHYTLVNESEEQIEFADLKNERYIKVTEERLQLYARSEAELTVAMAEIEAQCTSAVMYLAKTIEAKTIEERG